MYYTIENDGTIKKCDSMPTNYTNRSIKKTELTDDIVVSTVFLFMDHSFDNSGIPVLFETMVFGGEHDQYMDRYYTIDEAKVGHEKICEMVNPLPRKRELKIDSILK